MRAGFNPNAPEYSPSTGMGVSHSTNPVLGSGWDDEVSKVWGDGTVKMPPGNTANEWPAQLPTVMSSLLFLSHRHPFLLSECARFFLTHTTRARALPPGHALTHTRAHATQTHCRVP